MKKPSNLKTILTVLFTVCLILSNIVTVKQVQLPFGITVTGAMVVFPVTYILSDVFSEIYGYRWSRATCYIAFAMNLFTVLVFQLVIAMPAPSYFEGQEALEMILGSVPRVLASSMMGLLAGDFVNDRVFRAMKKRHPDELKGFGTRAILSSLAGEAADSAVFIPLAFIGTMPVGAMIIMGVSEVCVKVLYEVAVLPMTRRVCAAVGNHEKRTEGAYRVAEKN